MLLDKGPIIIIENIDYRVQNGPSGDFWCLSGDFMCPLGDFLGFFLRHFESFEGLFGFLGAPFWVLWRLFGFFGGTFMVYFWDLWGGILGSLEDLGWLK